MGSVITMSSTVGDLSTGQTYFVKSRVAELIVASSHGTIQAKRGSNQGVLPAKTGKSNGSG